jgi:hypothetical protein
VIQRLLDAAIVLFSTSLLLVLALGGVDVAAGPLHLRLHGWFRPLVLLAAALAVRGWRVRRSHAYAQLFVLSLILTSAIIYFHSHVRVAGGLDSYGYVSASRLIAAGHLTQTEPLVDLLPFERAAEAAAPFGYVPAPDAPVSVPRFPLGLPLVMALFAVFGPSGPFFVPILMALVTIALACLLAGGFPASPARPEPDTTLGVAGLLATALVAVDPLVVDSAIQPMSDMPATCWLLAAIWLRLAHPNRVLAAGLCAGMAVLTRPALLPAAAMVAVVTGSGGARRTIGFAATLAAFVALQMTLNWKLYGSPSMSGYGLASSLFELSPSRLAANLSNYGKWLTYSHSALVWIIWPAALVILRRDRTSWQISAVAAAAAFPYLFYFVFDDWQVGRFLLPTVVLVLILFARAVEVVLRHPPSRLRRFGAASLPHPSHPSHLPHLVVLVLAFAAAIASHRFMAREGVYALASAEAKFVLVGEWFRAQTSERAVVLAALHSGSIRFYGRRHTIRWDQIPPDSLEPTLRELAAAGYETYVALDLPTEPPLFDARFSEARSIRIDPIARVRVVNIYRVASER